MLHLDIWGPISVTSTHNHRYFLTILDEHTRFVWIVLLKTKGEMSVKVKSFVTMIENQYKITPKVLITDTGAKFLFPSFYESKGIIHHKSCVETPQ